MKKKLEPKVAAPEIQVSYKPLASAAHVTISDSQTAYYYLRPCFSMDTVALQEQMYILYLNNANHVLGVYAMSSGGMTGTVCDIRLILSVALRIASTAMIVSHNHPSGLVKPSRQDEELTKKLRQAAQVMDIKLLDHLIIHPTTSKYFSFADEGLLSS